MRYRANGGFLGPALTTNTAFASGVWSMPEFQQKLGAGTWPTDQTASYLADPNFEYVTMLLKSVGANTAQNYSILDSSASNLTVTRNGDVTQGAFSPHGVADGYWSNYFDGSGDYLSLSDNDAFDFGPYDFTMECWVYLTNTNGTGIVEHRVGTGATPWIWYIRSPNNYLELFNGTSYTGNISVPINQWSHVAISRSSGTLRMFVDGQVSYSSSVTASLDSTGAIVLMASNDAQQFLGYASNLRIVKGTAVYTSAFTPPTAPLTAISGTSLLTCQSNRFKDNSTNAFTITRNGDTKVSAFGPVNPSTAYSTSITGGSLYFDGTGDYLTAPYSTTNMDWYTTGTDYTIEAWIYPTTLTGWTYNTGVETPALVGNMDNASTSDYWSFGPLSNGTVRFYYYNGSPQTVTSSVAVNVGQWNHIAMTKTSSGITIFVNGVASTTTAISGTPQSSSGFPLTVGRSNSTAITGYVSSLRIVKGSAVYSGNFTLPTEPLTAITNTKYLLNGTNAAIIDASRKNNVYTVGNAQARNNVYKYDKSMYFDGSGDYITISANPMFNFGTGNFTIEFWSNYASTTGTQTIIDINYGTAPNVVFQPVNGTMTVYINGTATSLTGSTDTAGVWYHYALVRNGTTVTLYRNGTTASSATYSGNVGNATVPVYVGGSTNGGGYYFNGYLEDVRITSGYARYTSNFTVPANAFNTL